MTDYVRGRSIENQMQELKTRTTELENNQARNEEAILGLIYTLKDIMEELKKER